MNKFIFFFKRPPVVIVSSGIQRTIRQILGSHFKIGRDVLFVFQNFNFFIKYSRLPVLVVNQIVDNAELAEILPSRAYLILNSDNDAVRELKNKTKARVLTFGLGARADIKASDITSTNFKINYDGKTVPVWLPEPFNKEQIYETLAAAAVGEVLGLNLVEISEALKKNLEDDINIDVVKKGGDA